MRERERECEREQSTRRKNIGLQALITLSSLFLSLSLSFFYSLLGLMTAALLSSFTPPPSFSSVVTTMSNDDTPTAANAPPTSRATKHQSLPSSSSSTIPKNYSMSLPESSSPIQQPLSNHGKVKKSSRSDKASSKEHVCRQSFYLIYHHHHPFLIIATVS